MNQIQIEDRQGEGRFTSYVLITTVALLLTPRVGIRHVDQILIVKIV